MASEDDYLPPADVAKSLKECLRARDYKILESKPRSDGILVIRAATDRGAFVLLAIAPTAVAARAAAPGFEEIIQTQAELRSMPELLDIFEVNNRIIIAWTSIPDKQEHASLLDCASEASNR